MSKDYWNTTYKNNNYKKPKVDNWLDKYSDVLKNSKNETIIDLGCGLGNDSLYLIDKGYEVISCDYSEEALSAVKKLGIKNTLNIDMREELPFKTNSVGVIISDLSLHYYSWEKTLDIISEISRVLKPGGFLLCRVNSIKDSNYGVGAGIEVEKNYFSHNGRFKRFFTKTILTELFNNWDIQYLEESDIYRYELKKVCLEISIKNIKV